MEKPHDINDSDFANNVFKNMMDLFFSPEIARRKESNLLPHDFQLMAAQAIIFPDSRLPLIRLNSEVRADVKIKKDIDKDVPDFWPAIEDVKSVELAESQFLDCGHVTIILFKNGFQLHFDYQYNKQTSSEYLKVAKDFLQTSKFALENKFIYAFIDNAFSTVELLAKTNLLMEANPSAAGMTHRSIQTAFNKRFKNSKEPFEIDRRNILNRLANSRNGARYLKGKLVFDENELNEIYKTIESMFNDLNNRLNINVG